MVVRIPDDAEDYSGLESNGFGESGDESESDGEMAEEEGSNSGNEESSLEEESEEESNNEDESRIIKRMIEMGNILHNEYMKSVFNIIRLLFE